MSRTRQESPDGNLFSFYYPSRLDIRSGGRRVVCEDLRKGCAQLRPDREKPDFTYFRGAGLEQQPASAR